MNTELLNNLSKEDRDAGFNICKELSRDFNCFGSYRRKMNEFYNSLSPEGQANLLACICIAALDMAFDYQKFDYRSFDARKAASEEFSYEHRDDFGEMFEENTGWYPVGDTFAPTFGRGITDKMWCDNHVQAFSGFLNAWRDVHSTIKQAIFGGFVRGVMGDIYGISYATESAFPFI